MRTIRETTKGTKVYIEKEMGDTLYLVTAITKQGSYLTMVAKNDLKPPRKK